MFNPSKSQKREPIQLGRAAAELIPNGIDVPGVALPLRLSETASLSGEEGLFSHNDSAIACLRLSLCTLSALRQGVGRAPNMGM
jgi:hypothetical protein